MSASALLDPRAGLTDSQGMGLELAELRIDQVDDVVALVKRLGGSAAADRVNWTLSLLAKLDGRPVAAAVCCEGLDGHPHLEVAVEPEAADRPGIARLLVDKALQKIQARRSHKCTIRLLGEDSDALLWPDATWKAA